MPDRTGDSVLDRLRERLLAGAAPADVLTAVLAVAAARSRSLTAGLYRFDAEPAALTLVVTTDSAGGTRVVLPRECGDHPEGLHQFPFSATEVELWMRHDIMLHTSDDFERIHAYALCRPRLARVGIDRTIVVPIRRAGRLLGTFMLAAPADLCDVHALAPELSGLAEVAALALPAAFGDSAAAPLRASLEALNAALAEQIAARRRAEKLARAHTAVLTKSLALLIAEPDVDRFLGHALLAIVEGLGALGGTVWLPVEGSAGYHFHLECVGGRILRAVESSHPSGPRGRPSARRRSLLTDAQIERIPEIARADDPNLSEDTREYLGRLGVGALQRVPMRLSDTVLGWISIRHATLPAEVLDDGRAVAESLVRIATIAVHLSNVSHGSRAAAVVEERARLVREMHDTLAQQLTGLVVQLEAARVAATNAAPRDAAAHYDQAIMLARLSLQEARRSMQALRHDLVDGNDLPASLRELVTRAESRPALVVFSSISNAAPPWSSRAQTELLRMAQEAVTNALRHAQARTLTVTWERAADAWVLEVHDDGVGFAPGTPSDGMGLSILSERAARLGASLLIDSSPGHGTRVRVTRPERAGPPTASPTGAADTE